MKCSSCEGALSSENFLVCPYCGVRQEVDLRHVHFRELGDAEGMACPRCPKPRPVLQKVALDLGENAAEIARCSVCDGMFFDPGELEAFLAQHISATVWKDPTRLDLIRKEIQKMPRPDNTGNQFYIPCPRPGCGVSMNRRNFGRESGVLIDSCRDHGVWLDGGELRAISDWWHAGGKFIYEAAESKVPGRKLYTANENSELDLSECGDGSFFNPLDCAPDGPDTKDLIGVLGFALLTFFRGL